MGDGAFSLEVGEIIGNLLFADSSHLCNNIYCQYIDN
jgi:hypothetical protein